MLSWLFLSCDNQRSHTDQGGQRIVPFSSTLLLDFDELDNGQCGVWYVQRDTPVDVHNDASLYVAIYLVKRTLRNRQRHGLEEHELVGVRVPSFTGAFTSVSV